MTNHPAPTPPEADVQAAKTIKCHLCGNDVEQWPCSATGNEHRPAPEPTDQTREQIAEVLAERLAEYRRLWLWSDDREDDMVPGLGAHMEQMIYRLPRDNQTDDMRASIEAMISDLGDALARLAVHVSPETAEEAALDDALQQRDDAQEWADSLAYAIAPMEVIGEHTSLNNPWANALDMVGADVIEERKRIAKAIEAHAKIAGNHIQGDDDATTTAVATYHHAAAIARAGGR